MTWQPKETAPRDGSHILLWCTGEDRAAKGPVIGLWDTDKKHFALCLYHFPLSVSHWMPLPEPPTESTQISPDTESMIPEPDPFLG